MAMQATTLASPADAQPVRAPRARRDAGLDALRATLTLLVLFHHTAITYGAIGGWYYREIPTDETLASKLLIFFCAVNQAYFMGLFFLIAGYFTAPSLARHGACKYIKERLLRLGIPLAVFGFVISPFTIALAQTAKGKPFFATLAGLWSRGAFENGPLWFAQALLIFSFAFLVWHELASRFFAQKSATTPRPFPSNRVLALAALATGTAAFALRLIWPAGTQVLGLQLGYFASYVVLFAAGCIGSSGRWLDNVPDSQRRLWSIVTWLALPLLPIVFLLAPHMPALQGNSAGGWSIPAAVYAFWEPLVAWGLIMMLLHAFTRRFTKLGAIWSALARRAYAIYIIHPPILVSIALAWHVVPAPSLVKFAVTGSATCLACFWIAGLMLRVPMLAKML
jgi:fucose 4-O-acetylase-like acetyltransferase